jgi:protease II
VANRREKKIAEDESLLIMKTNMEGGHFNRSGLDELKDIAFRWAFLMATMEIPK